MTHVPQFLSFKKPLSSIQEFAELVEAKFGPGCTLVGKAVSLIGMLAKEFVFVFHEGASGYVWQSRNFHRLLKQRLCPDLCMNPILRVKYDSWSALDVTCSWIRLPEPFQRAFGTEEICSPSLAHRWKDVSASEGELLRKLGQLRRPIELIRYLDASLGGSWRNLADEYMLLQGKLQELNRSLEAGLAERAQLHQLKRELRKARTEAERRKGEHFRAKIFEKNPTPEDLAERDRLTAEVDATIHKMTELRAKTLEYRHRQQALVLDPAVVRLHERRRQIELEAELKRLRIIRGAYTTHKGLCLSSRRPSAWWFPLVSPDGLWFRETVDQARCYLEPLL